MLDAGQPLHCEDLLHLNGVERLAAVEDGVDILHAGLVHLQQLGDLHALLEHVTDIIQAVFTRPLLQFGDVEANLWGAEEAQRQRERPAAAKAPGGA